MVIKAIECVLTLFLMGAVGFVLAHRGWFSTSSAVLLPRLVTYIALPPHFVYTLLTTFHHDNLIEVLSGAILPFFSILLTFIVGFVFAKIFKISKKRFGIFCTGFATSNTVFIGIPVNLALYGAAAMPYVLLYFVANSVFFWTIGHYFIEISGDVARPKLFSFATLKQIFSPPLLGTLFAIFLILLNIRLPEFIMETCKYFGGLTTPLALLFIGITLHSIRFKESEFGKDLFLVLIGRFFIGPMVLYSLLLFFPVPKLMHDVYLVQSSLPIMTNIALLSTLYNADAKYGSLIVSVSTLCSLVSLPVVIFLLGV